MPELPPVGRLLPARRFRTAQTWWIASELVRRHPQLRITMSESARPRVPGSPGDPGTYSGDAGEYGPGAGRLLSVHDTAHRVHVNFAPGTGVGVRGDPHGPVTWPEVFASSDAVRIVTHVERAAGLDIPLITPAASPHSLVYRMIASALAAGVHDRHEWSAVPAPISAADVLGSAGGPLFQGFSSTAVPRGEYAARLQARAPARPPTDDPAQPFWALLRDGEPAAIFDTAGVVHTVLGATELLSFYEAHDRELTLITARILGAYLP